MALGWELKNTLGKVVISCLLSSWRRGVTLPGSAGRWAELGGTGRTGCSFTRERVRVWGKEWRFSPSCRLLGTLVCGLWPLRRAPGSGWQRMLSAAGRPVASEGGDPCPPLAFPAGAAAVCGANWPPDRCECANTSERSRQPRCSCQICRQELLPPPPPPEGFPSLLRGPSGPGATGVAVRAACFGEGSPAGAQLRSDERCHRRVTEQEGLSAAGQGWRRRRTFWAQPLASCSSSLAADGSLIAGCGSLLNPGQGLPGR